MTQFDFTINGNHEDPTGNPVPFQRVLKQHMRAASARYLLWSDHVRVSFLFSPGSKPVSMLRGKHPITKEMVAGKSVAVIITVTWKNKAHGDLDNVLKGILDALFEDDKPVNRIEASSQVGDTGRVRCKIIIE